MTAFDLEFRLSLQDYVRFHGQVNCRLSRTSVFRIVRPLVLGFTALLGFAVLQRLGLADGKSALAVFCAFAAGMLATIGLLYLQARANRSRMFTPHGVYLGSRRMRVSEQGIVTEAASHGGHFAWTAIHEVTASAGLVMLWIEPAAACIIPARAFTDEAEMHSFIAFAGKNIAMARQNAPASAAAGQG